MSTLPLAKSIAYLAPCFEKYFAVNDMLFLMAHVTWQVIF